MADFGHGSGLRGRAQPDRHQRPCRRAGRARARHCRGRRRPVRRRAGLPRPRSSPSIRRATSPCSSSSRARSPPIPLYVGPLDDGSAGRGAWAIPAMSTSPPPARPTIISRPLPPTRSVGIFSNVRPINGITTLLHTANIARGHSGGPLLDQCGRVLGVNTLITRNQDGDAPFAFAVANRELDRLPAPGAPALPGDRQPNASAWPTGCARTATGPTPRPAPAPRPQAAARKAREARERSARARSRRAARTGSRSPSCCSSLALLGVRRRRHHAASRTGRSRR